MNTVAPCASVRTPSTPIAPLALLLAAQAAHEEGEHFHVGALEWIGAAAGCDALLAVYVRARAEGTTNATPIRRAGEVALAVAHGIGTLPGEALRSPPIDALVRGSSAIARGASEVEVNREAGPPLPAAVDDALAVLMRYMGPPGREPAPWMAAFELVGAVAVVLDDPRLVLAVVVGAVAHLEVSW